MLRYTKKTWTNNIKYESLIAQVIFQDSSSIIIYHFLQEKISRLTQLDLLDCASWKQVESQKWNRYFYRWTELENDCSNDKIKKIKKFEKQLSILKML